jgi:hypothetical protein
MARAGVACPALVIVKMISTLSFAIVLYQELLIVHRALQNVLDLNALDADLQQQVPVDQLAQFQLV